MGMDENTLLQKLESQDAKLDAMQASLDKIRRYFQITFWVTIIFFVIPLVASLFVIPWALGSYLGSFGLDPYDQGNATEQIELLQELLQ